MFHLVFLFARDFSIHELVFSLLHDFFLRSEIGVVLVRF